MTIEWAGLFGYAGVAANIFWILMRRRTRLLAGQAIACGFMAAHFWLLESATGSAIMVIAGMQALLAIPLGTHPGFKLVYLASGVLAPVLCYVSWQGVSSLFSTAVLVLVCIANYQVTEVRQRGWLLLALLAWVVHNVVIGSVPALVSNGIALVVSMKMLIRAVRIRNETAENWLGVKSDR